MRTNQLKLLVWAILFAVIQATKESIGYELLFQYFAYKMEVRVLGASNTKIAFQCAGSGPGNMCTFMEFVKHVSLSSTIKDGPISWDPAFNQAGGPHTTDPDVLTVGRNFPTYALPNWQYSYHYLDPTALHREYGLQVKAEKNKKTFDNQLNHIYESIHAVRRPDGKDVPKDATLIPNKDPDLLKCIDAAKKASAMRRVDHEAHLLEALKLVKSYLDPLGFSKKLVIVTKRPVNLNGKDWLIIDPVPTMIASNARSPNEQAAFRGWMKGILEGIKPPVKDEAFDPKFEPKLKKVKSHVDAHNFVLSFLEKVQKC